MEYAPIVIFAFNRLNSLKACIASLKQNREAIESDLFVYVDGPRVNKVGEFEKVEAVREFVKTITGFRSLTYYFSEKNKGLANSIIGGTTEIINQYGQIIVLEDDLVVSKSFLRYMNEMLILFEKDERIMQISGYGCKLSLDLSFYPYDIYLNERAHSWSWATWKDRWETIDWFVADYQKLSKSRKLQSEFNKRGSDLYKMLKGYMTGRNNSWYIRFNYSMYKQKRFSIMPVKSLVRNDGFSSDATHCNTYNRYKIDFEGEHIGAFTMPEKILPNEKIIKNSVRYWNVRYRLYGKIMTQIMKIQKSL